MKKNEIFPTLWKGGTGDYITKFLWRYKWRYSPLEENLVIKSKKYHYESVDVYGNFHHTKNHLPNSLFHGGTRNSVTVPPSSTITHDVYFLFFVFICVDNVYQCILTNIGYPI